MTLIEVLVVVVILGILSGMLSVMLSIAQRQGKATNTRAMLMKVDQAIRLFHTDMRVYPWQLDLGVPPAEPVQWGNNLAWRLAWKPPPTASATPADPDRITYLKNFQTDLAAIQRCFRFVNGRNVPPTGTASEGTHAFRLELPTATSRTNLLLGMGTLQGTLANINVYAGRFVPGPGTVANTNDCTGDAQALTQMATEVTTLAYVAGQMPTLAPVGIDPALPADKARFPSEDERYPGIKIVNGSTVPFRYFPYNKAGFYGDDSRGPVLTAATARANGWRGDYLAGALRTGGEPGSRRDVDAGGEAIVDAWGRPLVYVCTVRPGVRGVMHGLTTSLFHGSREERYNMGPQGRDPTTALASDIRTTAGQVYVHEFELWSAGRDGKFVGLRSDPVNSDNISLLPYHKGLQ